MKLSSKQLREMLIKPKFISPGDFDLALKEAKNKNKAVEEVLVEKELISENNLGKLIAEELGFKFVDLENEAIAQDVINIVPEIAARNQQVIVFDRTKEGLKTAFTDPGNLEMIDWLERKTGEKIIPYYATPWGIRSALKYYQKELKKTFEEVIEEQMELAKKGKAQSQDFPIIKIVDILIEYAYQNRASDIHITPLGSATQVRFRIDGVLHNVLILPKDIHSLIVTRVKVLSKLRTDEHFAAQDGKFMVKLEKERFDVRVSIIPVTEGENVVMRLLSERSRGFSLEDLGLLAKDLKKVKAAIKKPYGMVLATGPTGCGKTTTLYAVLKILNKPEINICTIEDPVEYDIEGVNQIQVNPKTNLTFAKGLRSIVRQDPDIIMVGEVRDSETAGIAINSAMTGHLVLSTMHANTAATNIPRLIDMGAEPFLVASSINLIVAQRLVRKVCVKCRESKIIKGAKLEEIKGEIGERIWNKMFGKDKKVTEKTCYHGKGCKACKGTGFWGRVGIFEILEMKDNIKKLIMEKADADKIEAQAIKNGMTTMMEDGINKVASGLTTIEEVIRVTRE
ncbi:MAG: GspE/PulE family protein [bacterium]